MYAAKENLGMSIGQEGSYTETVIEAL